ncbi:hypothetical protein BACCELL_01544 [Bacteroides cellulosilyticus DSM 14838]|uniref:Uncharacterized protein n=1 Tax=Bacteroides cellulosilyticus DSM 14838 TaxID=537012 RepID=E2NB88_9BACE|nr:hypothetical protein BACCELL_01544 [Bacteroides cellulosilyticus DSM 14838]
MVLFLGFRRQRYVKSYHRPHRFTQIIYIYCIQSVSICVICGDKFLT